jgi:putative FmdB family regulatory protein
VPVYEYRCPNGHLFELFKRISDPSPEACEVCGASPVQIVLHPVPVHFKGSGFYATDYGRSSRKGGKEDGGGSSDGDKADTKSGDTKSADTKSGDTKSGDKKAAEA